MMKYSSILLLTLSSLLFSCSKVEKDTIAPTLLVSEPSSSNSIGTFQDEISITYSATDNLALASGVVRITPAFINYERDTTTQYFSYYFVEEIPELKSWATTVTAPLSNLANNGLFKIETIVVDAQGNQSETSNRYFYLENSTLVNFINTTITETTDSIYLGGEVSFSDTLSKVQFYGYKASGLTVFTEQSIDTTSFDLANIRLKIPDNFNQYTQTGIIAGNLKKGFNKKDFWN